MTTNDKNQLVKILNCGMKNCLVAKELTRQGFYLPVHGWDVVENGVYFEYSNDDGKHHPSDLLPGVDRYWEPNSDFRYQHEIQGSDIWALKKRYLN